MLGLKPKGGMFGASALPGMPVAAPETLTPGVGMAPQQAPAGGGLGDKLGIIGSILLNNYGNGGGNAFLQMIQQKRQEQLAQQRYQQQQQDEQAQWLARQEWQRQNPQPVAPHYFETNDGSQGVIGPDGKPQIIFQDTPAKAETERLIDTWNTLPKEDPRRPLIERAIRGAGYDPSVYLPKMNAQAAITRQTRAMPTYAQTHPKARSGGAPAKPPAGFILD